jgi:hypothetical protein
MMAWEAPFEPMVHARRRLIDVDVTKPRIVQRQGKRHAADATTRDRHAHWVRPASF